MGQLKDREDILFLQVFDKKIIRLVNRLASQWIRAAVIPFLVNI